MNKNKFSVNIRSNKDKADAPSEHKSKNLQEVLLTLALIFAAVMAVGIVSALAVSSMSIGSNALSQNKILQIAAVVVMAAGGLLMTLFMVLSMIVGIKDSKKRAASPSNVQYTVDSTVLTDPRVKQLPEVQQLLQYESVQKAFFSGQFPTTSEELADPYLQELVSVLSQLADENGVIRL